MSSDELEDYKEAICQHYRKHGYPFLPTDHAWRQDEFEKFIRYDPRQVIDYENKVIKQTMHGQSLCWSYHPHHITVKCRHMRSPIESFNNDDHFRSSLNKLLKIGNNVSDASIRRALRIYNGSQGVSNFRPTAAAAIYHLFMPNGGYCWDFSAGYGGRLLGAIRVGVNYIGHDVDQLTVDGLRLMALDFADNISTFIVKQGSELPAGMRRAVDLCFTSPPYLDTERYSGDPAQSWKKFPTEREWYQGFVMWRCSSIAASVMYAHFLASVRL